MDVSSRGEAAGHCLDELAALGKRARPRVDVNARARERLVVDFAHFRGKQADEIQVLS